MVAFRGLRVTELGAVREGRAGRVLAGLSCGWGGGVGRVDAPARGSQHLGLPPPGEALVTWA